MSHTIMPDSATIHSLLATIGAEHPELERMTDGTINDTWRVIDGEQTLYLRIGPSDATAEAGPHWMTSRGLVRELNAITNWHQVAEVLPVTVQADFSREVLPRDWVIQRAVRGERWSDLRPNMSADQDQGVWEQFGLLTRNLHRTVGQEFGPPDLGTGQARWSEMVRWDATGFLVDAQKFDLPMTPFTDLCECVDRLATTLDDVTEARLIHSDLHPRHVFLEQVGGEYRITGVIDAEFARFADPLSESVFVAHDLGWHQDPEFEAFMRGYGEPDVAVDRYRRLVYQAVALGWVTTDLVRRRDERMASRVLGDFSRKVDELRDAL